MVGKDGTKKDVNTFLYELEGRGVLERFAINGKYELALTMWQLKGGEERREEDEAAELLANLTDNRERKSSLMK